MLRYLLIILTVLVISRSLHGQQDVLYSQYMFDKMLINPAYAGSSKWVVGSLKNRMQFVKMEGAPVTNILTFQAPVQIKNIGLGLKVIQDNIAVTNSLTATGFFSYHIGFGKGRLSFGLEGGIRYDSYNYDELIRTDPDDPAILPGTGSTLVPEISTGIFYQSSLFYVGAAAYHLVRPGSPESLIGTTGIPLIRRSFYGTGGVFIPISDNFILEPGFLVKYMAGAPFQVDANLSAILFERFALGLSYRSKDAAVAYLKVDITKNIRIMYSYDYRISELASYSGGSHEIALSYGIELLPPPEKKVIHPRYYF
ncbi:MAG: type IX secretion system membrane protein PorP/SprF [Bacteroidota bacterium]